MENCDVCGATFKSKEELKEHSKLEHGIKCALCKFTCKDIDALSDHQIDKHSL